MWFAVALLVFSAVFVIVRAWQPVSQLPADPSPRPPGVSALLGFSAVLVAGTFLVRLAQPIGTSVLNMQLCFFPQYIAAFVVGVAAGRYGWLEALASSRRARIAGWLGVVGGPIVLAGVALVGGPPPENGPNPYAGGWNVRAFALAAWEQFAGLGIALGLLAWFQVRWNSAGRVARWFSDRAFAVYTLHAPVLVVLTPWIRPAAIHPFIGAALLTAAGLVASFLLADIARRLPGLRRIL